ncbi:hypothetical protein CAPI_00840 [Corynebacterium capitovis DSM 44611]|uniref:hypothetical protein n=1 Tax=Corynebacterium capitovis TaxID=131081 RepID=UPI00038040E0|nr:hypothetical protein [Corynebacterium capitovis]WKD56746.1 hypothetical protein CAPI_00840 [Corynebacterium capitovis DSM 44611]
MKALSLSTVFAALSGFVVLWVAQWALGAETDYRYFAAFWGLFFAATGLIDGMTHETTRAVSGAVKTGVRGSGNPWGLAAGAAVAALVAGGVLAAAVVPRLVPTAPVTAGALCAVGLVSYVFQAILSGVLSGTQRWNRYAALLALDAGLRLALALVAWWRGWGLPAFLVITVIGALSWLVVVRREYVRTALDVDTGELLRRVLSAMVASGGSAILIMGFPTAASAAFPADEGVAVSAIINAVILTRAPVLVPLQRFQSALVVRFVENRHRIYSALRGPIALVMVLGTVGFVAAWALGPWILRLAFKPEMFVPGLTLGVLTFASAFMGSLMITGVALLALKRHGWYVAGWVAATLVTLVLLFVVPLPVSSTACVALIVGPLTGSVVHVLGLRRAV